MDLLKIIFVVLFAGGLAFLIRRISALNSAPTGFAIVARYPTTTAAAEACAFLRHHGIRAEADNRRRAVKLNVLTGAVHVLVPTDQAKRAERAFARLSRASQSGQSS